MRHARRADGEDALVEDDLRVVRVILSALVHVARAKVHHRARHALGHKRKVLGARRRNAAVRRKVRDVQFAHVAQHVVRHRLVAHKRAHLGKRLDLHRRVVHGGRAFCHLAHAAHQQCAGLLVVCADGTAQHGRVRDDVRRRAGHKLSHSQHAGLRGFAFARDELLQREMNVHAHVDGVNGNVRVRAVRAAPVDRDLKPVYGGHHHARVVVHHKAHGRFARRHVVGERRVHRRVFEQPVFQHVARALKRLLRGLKHQFHRAAKRVFVFLQHFRRRQKHRRVHVVSAGVCRFAGRARERLAALLGHRQRVHVGAQQKRFAGLAERRRHAVAAVFRL